MVFCMAPKSGNAGSLTRIDKTLLREAREYGIKNGHFLNWVINQAVREYLDRRSGKGKA
jgi:hypothetical protein